MVGNARHKVFNQEFMEKNFSCEHQEAFPGQSLPLWGLPDIGSGRYS